MQSPISFHYREMNIKLTSYKSNCDKVIKIETYQLHVVTDKVIIKIGKASKLISTRIELNFLLVKSPVAYNTNAYNIRVAYNIQVAYNIRVAYNICMSRAIICIVFDTVS